MAKIIKDLGRIFPKPESKTKYHVAIHTYVILNGLSYNITPVPSADEISALKEGL